MPAIRIAAVADLEIARAGFQRFGRDLLQLVAEIAGGALDADAAGRDRRRAAGAETGGDLVGVALQDMDALGRQAELLGDESARRRSGGPARSTGCRSGW